MSFDLGLGSNSVLTNLGVTDVTKVPLSYSNAVSELALSNSTSLSVASKVAQSKKSDERLFLARPRSADKKEAGSDGRGQWAYIKLLTNPTLQTAYNVKDLSKRSISDSNPYELMSYAATMAAKGTSYGYDKFLLTGVSGSFSEKLQVTEVFGDGEVCYYFGRQPMMIGFSGILIDSPDNTWFTDWMRMYSEFLRGSQLARNFELLKIVLPNMIVTGSITGMSWQQGSDRDTDIPFSFQFMATKIEPVPIVSPEMVYNNGAQKIQFEKAASFFSQSSINSLKSNYDAFEAIKIIQDPTSSLAQKSKAMASVGGGLSGAAKAITTGSSFFDSLTSKAKAGTLDTLGSPMFQGISSTLNGIRSSLFSPIYGVLSSLTKLISVVSKGTISIFSSLITPVRNVLRDITNISNQAISVVNAVNNAIRGVGRYITSQLKGLDKDYNTALKTVGKASGVIASAPITIAQSASHMFSNGSLSYNAAFLQSKSKGSLSQSSSLGVIHGTSLNRVAILKSGTPYTPAAAAVLHK